MLRQQIQHIDSRTDSVFLSVIVPVYNTDMKLLAKCLASLITINEPVVEVIIVDDGSYKETSVLLDGYSSKYANCRVFHKRNGGQNSARHYGVKHSRGLYCTFVDSDDWIDSDAFERALMLLFQHKPPMLAIDYSIAGNNGIARQSVRGFTSEYSDMSADSFLLRSFTLWGIFFRRDILEDSVFCTDSRIGEDIATIAPIVLAAEKVHVSSLDVYRYYLSENSVMRTTSRARLLDILISFQFLNDQCMMQFGYIPDVVIKLAIIHILYFGSRRVVISSKDYMQFKKLFFKFMNDNYIDWRSHLNGTPYSKSISFFLLTHGFWGLYSILHNCKHLL